MDGTVPMDGKIPMAEGGQGIKERSGNMMVGTIRGPTSVMTLPGGGGTVLTGVVLHGGVLPKGTIGGGVITTMT